MVNLIIISIALWLGTLVAHFLLLVAAGAWLNRHPSPRSTRASRTAFLLIAAQAAVTLISIFILSSVTAGDISRPAWVAGFAIVQFAFMVLSGFVSLVALNR